MSTLIIRHVPKTEPALFEVIRPGTSGDVTPADPVEVTSPLAFPVEGRPNSSLLAELPWYLEEFLNYPFDPNTDRAAHIVEALESWGKKAFDELFNNRESGVWFNEAVKGGYKDLQVLIRSDDPAILQWPWEALHDPQAHALGVVSRVERSLNKVGDPIPLSEELPKDRINILMVTARPHERDVGYRSMSRPLVELIERNKIPAHVRILRPPTFARLRDHLKENPHFYHIIHFDGHGGYGADANQAVNVHSLAAKGVLVFEDDEGKPNEITAEQLSGLMRDYAVPVVVLNACRSATQSGAVTDPFASVAAALLQAGVRSVVAMAYSLWVSGAQQFLPAFYRELFDTGDFSMATRAGRGKMFEQMNRICARGHCELKDFIVPVHYQQEPYNLDLKDGSGAEQAEKKPGLPEGATDKDNPYGFIGRDYELLKLERAIRKDTPAVLIQGLGGVGKSTLARGFVKWLHDTGGMDGCLWFNFIDIKSAEYVINAMGSQIFDPNFIAADMDQKLGALSGVFKENRLVIVWDNFENVAGIDGTYIKPNLSAEDRNLLATLLKNIRGGKSKVIITSRSEEDWLGVNRMKESIGGLIGEERWEYCHAVLDNLGLKVDRTDEDQVELMDLLGGHPLAMRVILPKLEKTGAGQIITAIKSNIKALGPGTESLYGALRFTEDGLPDELKPLLIPLAFHEHYVDSDYLEHMAKQVDETLDRRKIDSFTSALVAAGLLRLVGQSIFEMHPALTGYLRSTLLKAIQEETCDKWCSAYVDIMGSVANQLAPRELHEQCFNFHLHRANFHFALAEAERLKMNTHEGVLIQSLAAYALGARNFAEAHELSLHLTRAARKAGNEADESVALYQLGLIAQHQRDFGLAEKRYLESLEIDERLGDEWGMASIYHQLGIIAQEQRDFEAAEKWYLKALEIKERLKDERGAAGTYHQLGIIAVEQRDFDAAEKWYLKSLEIKKRLGNEQGAATTYHQLGRMAEEQRDFKTAEKWYLKSLEIKERLKDEPGAATTYHQLGSIAEEQRDFEAAEKWCLKSLQIKERLGDKHSAASTYDLLGLLAARRGNFVESGSWLLKAIKAYTKTKDPERIKRRVHNFLLVYQNASPEIQAKLKAMWEEAGLGPMPEIPDDQAKN